MVDIPEENETEKEKEVAEMLFYIMGRGAGHDTLNSLSESVRASYIRDARRIIAVVRNTDNGN